MDPLSSTSFIPKKPLISDARATRKGPSLVGLISVLVFIASLVAGGAAFTYKLFLERSLTQKAQELQQEQEAYGADTINDLVHLDNRLKSGKKILATHLSASTVFTFLSAQTLEKVQFNSFAIGKQSDIGTKIVLDGQADSFATIALQSDQFGGSKVLHEVVFSNIVISPETGRVTFTVTATVDPALLLYSQSLGNSPASTPSIPPPATDSGSTTAEQPVLTTPTESSTTPSI